MSKFIHIILLLALSCPFLVASPKPATATLDTRLVVVGGDLTEIVFALNQGSQVVAIDDSSSYPEQVKHLPSVGYVRALSTEGVLSVKPDRLIVSAYAGPKPVVKQLKQAGIDIATVPQKTTIAGIKQKIMQIADFLAVSEQGKALVKEVDQSMQQLTQRLQQQPHRKNKAMIFMGMQSGQLMAAGTGTKASAVLKLMGLDNPMKHKSYKPLSQEALIKVNPEIIIVALMPNQAADQSPFKHTKAYQNKAIYFVDSNALLSFGPRLPQTLLQLVESMQQNTQPIAQQ